MRSSDWSSDVCSSDLRGATIFGSDRPVSDAAGALFKDHTIALPMFPNSFMAVDPAGFAWQSWWPTGPKSTVMVMTVMGWPDNGERGAEYWENKIGRAHV